jgi:hypothetical protein
VDNVAGITWLALNSCVQQAPFKVNNVNQFVRVLEESAREVIERRVR